MSCLNSIQQFLIPNPNPFGLRRRLRRLEAYPPRLRDRANALPQPERIEVNLKTAESSLNKTFGMMLVIVFMLLGCSSSDEGELTHYINNVKTRPAKPIEPLPTFMPLPKFIYPEEDTRRSPFKPRVVEQSGAFSPNIKRPKQPLEAFPLDALKFVGTLNQGSTTWALIKQPDGLVSRAKPGDYMGQNYGQIVSIKMKKMTLDEAIQVEGKWEKRRVSIDLSVPD